MRWTSSSRSALGPGRTSDLIRSVARAPVGVDCRASLAFKAAAAHSGSPPAKPIGSILLANRKLSFAAEPRRA